MLAGLKSKKTLLLCRTLKSISLYVDKTHCKDKGFIRIAIDVFFFIILIEYKEPNESSESMGST